MAIRAIQHAVAAAALNSISEDTLTVATLTFMLDAAPMATPGCTVDVMRSLAAQASTRYTRELIALGIEVARVTAFEEPSETKKNIRPCYTPFA